jgi:hypothetical protein
MHPAAFFSGRKNVPVRNPFPVSGGNIFLDSSYVFCRHHFPFLAMAAKVGSDCVKFVFNDVWKLLTNKEGWSHKKKSVLDTDWWVLPHAKSKRKVELVQKVDYVKSDIEVIGHVLNSDKRVVLFGFLPELDSAVASVIIA